LGSISFIISEKILKQKNTTKLVRGPWAQVDLETLTSEDPYGPMLNIDRIVFNPSLIFGIHLSKVIRGVQYLYHVT
jgi:hypothetical protein